jgi:hypothetical protein
MCYELQRGIVGTPGYVEELFRQLISGLEVTARCIAIPQPIQHGEELRKLADLLAH